MLRKAIQSVFVSERDSSHINAAKAFASIDTDMSGTIDQQELVALLNKHGVPHDDITLTEILKRCDKDGNGW